MRLLFTLQMLAFYALQCGQPPVIVGQLDCYTWLPTGQPPSNQIWQALLASLFFAKAQLTECSVFLNPSFHASLPTPRILSHMHFFHSFSSTFILRFPIPFTLASLSQIRFTNSINPNLLHICLHRAHHLDLHPIST